MKYRSILALVALLCATPALAGPDFSKHRFTTCALASGGARQVESEGRMLLRNYPGTLIFYMVSGKIIADEVRPDTFEKFVGSVTVAFAVCAAAIDTKSCEKVGKSLVAMAFVSALVKIANKEMRCGVRIRI
ncbi:MAG: hypothetical protein MRY74_08495 [Neomegalonema sp.]|nr:hypothetical protein [Neomegalonema sp.]